MLGYQYHNVDLSLFNISKYMLKYERMDETVHGRWCNRLEHERLKHKRLLKLMPRGTFKTTLLTISQTIELLMQDWIDNDGEFTQRILITSATENLATQMLGEISTHFNENKNLHDFFGYNPVRSVKHGELWLQPRSVKKEPTVKAIGSGTAVTSEHYDKIFCDDICFDKETEVLTDKGWKYFKDLDRTELIATVNPDTNILEYQKPIRYIQHDYNGTMYGIKGRDSADILVTKGHNIYWGRGDKRNRKYSLEKVEDIYGSYGYLQKTCEWKGEDDEIVIPEVRYKNNYSSDEKVIPMDDFCEFLGLFLAEGSISSRHGINHNSITITQNCVINADKCDEIRRILNKLPFDYKEYRGTGETKKDALSFVIGSSQLANYLHSIGGCTATARNKYVPDIIKPLKKEYIQKFIDGYFLGDGSTNKTGSKIIYTSSTRMADDLQELIIKCGYASSKQTSVMDTVNPSGTKYHTTQYRVSIIFGKCKPFIRPHHWYTQEYNDMVYCVEVQNHLLIIRKNGKAVICGNCNAEDRESQATRERNIRWFIDLISILEPDGYLGVWGTRWHFADVYNYILELNKILPEKQKYSIQVEAAIDDKTGETLFPTILTNDRITALKMEKGVIEFAAQYLNLCIPTETQLFPIERMHFYPEYGPDSTDQFQDYSSTIAYCDPALGKSEKGDYLVIVIATIWQKKMYIRDVYMSNTTTPEKAAKIAEQMLDKYDISSMYMESNGFQTLYTKYYLDLGIPIIEYRNTKNKEVRISGLEPYVSSGKVVFREDWQNCYPKFIEQLNMYPATDHDDAPDALEGIVKIGFGKATGTFGYAGLAGGITRSTNVQPFNPDHPNRPWR